jgi:glycosyltransferase involved in cell wall biosynthesis
VDRHRIAVVIPALNEAATIGAVVRGAARFGTPIVVDDGSRDDTGARASEAGAAVVHHPANRGYDGALNSGFARADELGCEFVVTMDADGQHDLGMFAAFLRELEQGADVVVGVRDRRQRLGEHIYAAVGAMMWGIRDPLCGMKAYRTSVWRELGHFDSYNSIGTELAVYGARKGKRIAQVPVKTHDRLDAPRFGRRFAANRRILRALWITLLNGRNR